MSSHRVASVEELVDPSVGAVDTLVLIESGVYKNGRVATIIRWKVTRKKHVSIFFFFFTLVPENILMTQVFEKFLLRTPKWNTIL